MGINEDLKELKELIKDEKVKKKEKKFRYPFGKKVSKAQKKKNYITILKVNENNTCQFVKKQIEDQTFIEDGVPRLASAGYVLQDRKTPLVILPSWSVEPFSPLKNYQESLSEGNNTVGYRLLMNRMKSEQITGKKQVGGLIKWIIGLGLVAIIIYAVITGGGI